MSDHSELKRRAEEILEIERLHPCGSTRVILVNPAAVLALIAEVEGLRAQHGRDSAELRSLCQARDDARKDRDQLKAEVARSTEREIMQLAEIEVLRKDAELHQQIQRAAKDLPFGWEIRVCVERESGYVELWDQDGCEVDFPNSCESLALTVSDAIDGAMTNGEQP